MAWDDMYNSDEQESNEWVTGDKNFEALNSLRDKLIEHSIHMLMDVRVRTELIADNSIPMEEKISNITEMLQWATEVEWYEECAVLYKMIKQIKESPYSQEQLSKLDEDSANERMNVIGQNGNTGLHYSESEIDESEFDDYGQLVKPNKALKLAAKRYKKETKKTKKK